VKVVVTVPTYNEIENIEALIGSILEQDERIDVLVIDDDSPDGTWRKVGEMSASNPRVHVLHRTTDRGRGRSGRDGYAWALAQGADVVFEMDADFSHNPRFIPAMLEALERTGADVVIGSRQVPGGKDIGRPASRVWLTHASNLYVRVLLGVPVRDCNSGFRAFRRSALEAIHVAQTFSPGPAIVHELLYKAHSKGLKFVEIPIEFVERELGESTLSFGTLLRSYFTILRLRWLGLTGRLFENR
jgi:dolichol-phosphate mannosyltransferase